MHSGGRFNAAVLTGVEFLTDFGEEEGLEMLEERGGLFSLAGLEVPNILDVTGWFFFPGGSLVTGSAGRFMPPIPPTVCKHKHRVDTRWRRIKAGVGMTLQRFNTHWESVRGSNCSTERHTSEY